MFVLLCFFSISTWGHKIFTPVQECHDLGIAAELCSSRSSCCPAFVPADGIGELPSAWL